MIIIGTAGHIDHGKSSIVKRLTGTDPDRLPEEQKRGMTIDLGFAFYKTPDDDTIAFVDVPGHERFVRNMIAGAGGIDIVMLVVAADDGWMPQSEEHFQITRLLGVREGLIVINKCDLVDENWLELLKQEVHEKVQGSFLAGAPIFTVSAETGEGFEPLIEHLNKLPTNAWDHHDINKARLYIDRSFVRQGIGAVVTGTLRDGSLKVGQTVSVWPSLERARIRSLQSNNRDVDKALPGQRTAVSLTGVKKEMLVRGGALSDRADLSHFRDNPVLALRVNLLRNAPVSIGDRRRLLLIVGTSETEGEIRLYNHAQMRPGGSGIVFFKPDEPVYSLVGDHFIIRLPTPMVTLGGGVVLDHFRQLPRKRHIAEMEYLLERDTDQIAGLVLSEVKKEIVVSKEKLLHNARVSSREVESAVALLLEDNRCEMMLDHLFEPATMARYSENILQRIEDYLKKSGYVSGLSFEQVSQLVKLDPAKTNVIISYLVHNQKLARNNDTFNLPERSAKLSGPVLKAYEVIVRQLKESPYSPPALEKLASGGAHCREAIKYMLEQRHVYKCGSVFLFLSDVWNEVIGFIREELSKENSLTVAALRDRFGFSRKYVIPILEETDRIGLTSRRGDVRVKGEKFES